MTEKSELIVRRFIEKLSEESVQDGSMLHGFRVYDTIPRREPLFYPCIVVIRGTEETVEEYFGGGSMTSFNIKIQLAVKEKSAVENDIDTTEDEAMLMRYRDFLDDFFDAAVMNIPEINIGLSGNSFALRVPGPENPIFGVEMNVQITYEDD